MINRLKRKYGLVTPLLFAATYVFVLALIWQNRSRPMWYDEVWRPYLIDNGLRIPYFDNQGLAPIAFGVYWFTKGAVLFADNNFTQRLIVYLALLALPVAVYKFCRLFLDKRTAQAMIPLSVLCGYILEFSTQDKPYVIDVVCMLGLFIAYQRFKDGKFRLWQFIAVSILATLFSMASAFALACVGLFMLYELKRNYSIKRRDQLIAWAGVTGLAAAAQYWFFLKPQMTPKVYNYYKLLYPHGGLLGVIGGTIGNLLSIFGFYYWVPLSPGTEGNTAFWTRQELLFYHPVLGLQTAMSLVYLGLFGYGMVMLYRCRRFTVFYGLVVIFALEWVAAMLRQWPFGNSRTNIFSLFLVTIIICYGGVSLVAGAVRKHQLAVLAFALGMVLTLFPYGTVAHGLEGKPTFVDNFMDGYQGVESGGEASAKFVSSRSKRSDSVLVEFVVRQYPFRYYYEYSDYTKPYKATRSQNVYYGKPNGFSEALLNRPAETIWLVDATNDSEQKTLAYLEKKGYMPSLSLSSGDITVEKLTR